MNSRYSLPYLSLSGRDLNSDTKRKEQRNEHQMEAILNLPYFNHKMHALGECVYMCVYMCVLWVLNVAPGKMYSIVDNKE